MADEIDVRTCWVCGTPASLVGRNVVCPRCEFTREWSELEASTASATKRVLVIEDDPMTLRLEQSLLAEDGFAVDSAPDGVIGLEKLRKLTYDAIVLDVGLPGMDGYEVAARIRGLETNRDTPLIMVTASTDPDARTRGFAAGVIVFVRKPFTASTFRSIIQSAIR